MTAHNDVIPKLYLANQHAGIMVAGAGDLGSTIVDGFLGEPGIAALPITQLTLAFHEYARRLFAEWFPEFVANATPLEVRPVRPEVNFLIAGFDDNRSSRIHRLSSSLDFAPMLNNYGFGVDGVAQYAVYLLNRLYDANSPVEELMYLAAYLITETASQDGKVGGPVQMATIDESGSGMLSRVAVNQILKINEERSSALRGSFIKRDYVEKRDLGSDEDRMTAPLSEPVSLGTIGVANTCLPEKDLKNGSYVIVQT